MTEHPILFSGEMVRAILDGRKTQTRRVITKQNSVCAVPFDSLNLTNAIADNVTGDCGVLRVQMPGMCYPNIQLVFPRYRAGNRLWVRETWAQVDWVDENDNDTLKTLYRATDDYNNLFREDEGDRWRPSIHMPRWASRITLEVTGVRAERLRDITEEDAQKEGIVRGSSSTFNLMGVHRALFSDLWDSINSKRGYGWDVNPWVFVICFKVVDK